MNEEIIKDLYSCYFAKLNFNDLCMTNKKIIVWAKVVKYKDDINIQQWIDKQNG